MVSGHTHNDVDADFGSFSCQLRLNDAYTPSEMAGLYKDAVSEGADRRMKRSYTASVDGSGIGYTEYVMVDCVPDFKKEYCWQVTVCITGP